MKWLLLCLPVVLCVSCWMFEKTDDRPAPIVEAGQQAAKTFSEVKGQVPDVPVPGFPTGLVGIIAGGAAAVSSFVTVLIRRKRELNAKAEVASPPPSPGA